MKIIGANHDYYDSVLLHGRSSEFCLVRKEATFSRKEGGGAILSKHDFMFVGFPKVRDTGVTRAGRTVLLPFCVAFCGKLYAGVQVLHWSASPSQYSAPPLRQEFLYEVGALERFIKEVAFRGLEVPLSFSGNPFGHAFMKFLATGQHDHSAFFIENREALVVARLLPEGVATLTLNPLLKTVEFFKVIDAWQAFQELEMFLGGIAAPENQPPVVIGDKDRVAQRGFDKYSFRKAPTKRRSGE